jgi:hypothetical protein
VATPLRVVDGAAAGETLRHQERLQIEAFVRFGQSLPRIAEVIGRDRNTVRRGAAQPPLPPRAEETLGGHPRPSGTGAEGLHLWGCLARRAQERETGRALRRMSLSELARRKNRERHD